MLGDLLAQVGPIHFCPARHINVDTTFVFQEINRILGKNTSVPLRTFVAGIRSRLSSEIGGSIVGVVCDCLHELIIELNGGIRGEREALFIERVLQTHHTHSNWPVTAVRCLRSLGRVKVNIDNIIKGTDSNGNRFFKHLVIERAIRCDVSIEHYRSKVAHRGLLIGSVEGNFRAQVAGVNHAAMILWAAQVTWILKGNPWVTCFEDHLKHAFPEFDGGHLAGPDFSIFSHFFILCIAKLKCFTIKIVQVRCLISTEKGPVLARLHALHEQVWNPVCRVHVMTAATLVTGVLTKLKKVFNVVVP